jgi:hypothetical protein
MYYKYLFLSSNIRLLRLVYNPMSTLEVKVNILIINKLTKTQVYFYSSNSKYSKGIEQIAGSGSARGFEYEELFWVEH